MAINNLMQKCNNYFERFAISGDFTIADGKLEIDTSKFAENQYIRIMGSLFNDNVYKISSIEGGKLTLDISISSETFTGYVVGLAVPKDFVELSTKIDVFNVKNEKSKNITSESVQGYYNVSYDKSITDGIQAYSVDVKLYKKPYMGVYYFLNEVDIYE